MRNLFNCSYSNYLMPSRLAQYDALLPAAAPAPTLVRRHDIINVA